MLTLFICLATILPAFVTARKVRKSLALHLRRCTDTCRSRQWSTTQSKNSYCNCGARDGGHVTPDKFWFVVGSFFLWPIYVAGWFVITDTLPTIKRKTLAERTAILRDSNTKMGRELDDIERRLAEIG